MFGSIPALLAGIGGLTKAAGHFTGNRDLLKIGAAGQMLGAGLGQISDMTAGSAASGAKEATTAENFSLDEGSALDSVLKGNFPGDKSWGNFDSLLKKDSGISSGKGIVPDLAGVNFPQWFS